MLYSTSLEPYGKATEPLGARDGKAVIKSLYCIFQGKYQAMQDGWAFDVPA